MQITGVLAALLWAISVFRVLAGGGAMGHIAEE